ncbi:MAG TPA: cell envelope integrity protein TolA [Xanthomonadales bacterium]|nr:cell envelope integrity protein TolA [Xanthomonadales bacterium]
MLRSFGLAISVHVLMVLLIVLGTMNWKPFRQPQPVGMTIEAVIVDSSAIRERREEAARAAAEAEQRKQAQERRALELEQQSQREKETAVQRQKDLAVQKQKEREETQRKKAAQDKLAALRAELERKQEEERIKQQKELEQVRQQAQAAEKKRQQEAERLKQMEARKQAEVAEQRLKAEEAERQKQAAAAAAQAGRIASLGDEYEAAIRALVTQNWLRPPTAQAGLRCTLKIAQIPGGEVISAVISGSCNGDDATRRSIIDAVERASPLPYSEYRDVFEREIDFIFIYDGE